MTMFWITAHIYLLLTTKCSFSQASLYFSGDTEYAVIPDYSLIDEIGNGDFTIQSWFSIASDDETNSFSSILGTSIINNTNNTTTTNDVNNNNNGFIFGIALNNIGAAPWIKLDIDHIVDCCSYDDGNWHHFVAVRQF